MFAFTLTDTGKTAVNALNRKPAFADLAEQMTRVKRVLGNKKGSALKRLVYQVFGAEVGDKSLGDVIG